MVEIHIYNQKSKLVATRKKRYKIWKDFAIKDKKAFWARLHGRSNWDGYLRYISEETGSFSTGLLDQLINLIKKHGWKYTIIDHRPTFKDLHEITELGELKFRPDQRDALRL